MATAIITKQFLRTVGAHQHVLLKTTTTSSSQLLVLKHNYCMSKRQFGVGTGLEGAAARAETTSTTQGLSKLQAQELVLRLTTEERVFLISALQEYQSKSIKDEYEAESVPHPTNRQLIDIAVANSIPFVGFGFLDNFFMLLFGDYIDLYLGSYFCMSTMAAAALGNTFSDVLGIGTAFYVERLANRIGFNPPKLSPMQMDMPRSRNFANLGRVLGVTVGCLLGMFPLLFRKSKEEEAQAKAEVIAITVPLKD
ncbi:PREDICTED: transmembrane protein 65 isoform X2 [Nicrophorus vespilloides]|uniref:Transmembrane protein 65 isoform X2 n=1 Tax=Nicrophorus vespilloides TaxID=110193 RepID=A0ABM1MJX2_NICVS|nr:PREDICTED: transmembrane protein 65 isoform X2 [Nicrophorus vespilloides]